jgi:hypothetical protein
LHQNKNKAQTKHKQNKRKDTTKYRNKQIIIKKIQKKLKEDQIMTKQQVGIELLKEFANTEYKSNLENNKFAEQFERGMNTAKWMVKTILEQAGL